VAAPRYTALYDPEHLILPPEPAVPPAEDPRLPAVLRAYGQRGWQPHVTWPLPPPGHPERPAARRRWLAAYYACVSQMDAAAGQVLDTLDALGLADRTLVLYTSDHGEMAGEHGLHQKFVFYEGSARVPLLMRCPWLAPAGTASRTPVDLADLVPTCLDVCDLPFPDPTGPHALEGTSLAPLLQQPERTAPHGKGFAFSEMAYSPGPAYMIRRGRWKYVHYTGTNERQLFDLDADPGEVHDLAGTPAAAPIEADLRRRLLHWLPAQVPR
jgi:arylsulfatase A-like enzyme